MLCRRVAYNTKVNVTIGIFSFNVEILLIMSIDDQTFPNCRPYEKNHMADFRSNYQSHFNLI